MEVELVLCKDCAFCHATTYDLYGNIKITHECRRNPPAFIGHEATWPVVSHDTGCCGMGRKKSLLP